MSEGRAKGPSLTALQHKWRELTVPAVRCRDPARAKPMLGVWQLAQRPRMDRRNQRPLNSDLDREAASPSVPLWQRGFVSPKLPPAAASSRRNKKPGAVSRPGMVAYYWIVRSLYEIRVTRVKGRRRSTLQRS